MDVVRSRVDTGSEGFRRNRQDMLALLAEVEAQLALARAGGGERSVARHHLVTASADGVVTEVRAARKHPVDPF